MQDYVVISATTSIGAGKKYDIMKLNNPIIIPDTPTEWSGTLNGTTVSSEGIGKNQYSFEVLCRYGETRSGYGTMTDLKAIFTSAGMIRAFTDWYGSTVSVHLLNKGDWKGAFDRKSSTVDAANSVYFVKFEMRQA